MGTTDATAVGVVDDHPITRAAVRLLLEEAGFHVAAEAASGDEALAIVERHGLDALLLDLDMPGRNGIDVLPRLRHTAPQLVVVVLTSWPADQYEVPLLRSGATAYLNKGCAPRDIVETLRRCCDARAQRLRSWPGAPGGAPVPAPPLHDSLSPRELQVFLKLARGEMPARVAAELNLNAKTVSTYRVRLLAKLGLRSNSDLTRYALEHRLIV